MKYQILDINEQEIASKYHLSSLVAKVLTKANLNDSQIQELLTHSDTLTKSNAKCVKEAFDIISKNEFSLCILDLTLPDGNGYDVCKFIKSKYNIPVIFLTAADDEVNAVMGLEMGADDYISKPFRLKELMARIKMILKRYSKNGAENTARLGDITINISQAKVYKRGEEIILSAMEYRLLLIFVNNPGVVMSRLQLLENIWDVEGDFVNDNTLTVYIKRLRDKLEDDPSDPKIIKTVRGLGYAAQSN